MIMNNMGELLSLRRSYYITLHYTYYNVRVVVRDQSWSIDFYLRVNLNVLFWLVSRERSWLSTVSTEEVEYKPKQVNQYRTLYTTQQRFWLVLPMRERRRRYLKYFLIFFMTNFNKFLVLLTDKAPVLFKNMR